MMRLIDRLSRLPMATTMVHVMGFGIVVLMVLGYQQVVRGRWTHEAIANGRRIAQLRQLMNENPELREQVHEVRQTVEQEALSLTPQDLTWAESANDAAFLATVSDVARRANLEIDSFRRGQTHHLEKYHSLDISLKCRGDFQAFCELLENIDSLDHVVRITQFKVKNEEFRQRLDAEITFTLFYGFDQPHSNTQDKVAVNQ